MKVINFAETNSVINQYVAEIRDVNIQGDRMRLGRPHAFPPQHRANRRVDGLRDE